MYNYCFFIIQIQFLFAVSKSLCGDVHNSSWGQYKNNSDAEGISFKKKDIAKVAEE